MNTKIKLNPAEQLLCKLIASERYKTARSAGVKNSRVGDQSDEETDHEGVAARSSKKGEDKTGDITINGLVIDVKATTYSTGRLIAAEWKDHSHIDYYGLVVGSFPEYEVKGVMSTEELIQPERLKCLPRGRNKVYQATQSELTFPEQLENQNATHTV